MESINTIKHIKYFSHQVKISSFLFSFRIIQMIKHNTILLQLEEQWQVLVSALCFFTHPLYFTCPLFRFFFFFILARKHCQCQIAVCTVYTSRNRLRNIVLYKHLLYNIMISRTRCLEWWFEYLIFSHRELLRTTSLRLFIILVPWLIILNI